MNDTPQFPAYAPSGKLAWHAPLKVLVIGVPGAAFLAWLYALCLHYSPGALISLFGLALFSVFLGAFAWFVLKQGHSRSRGFNRLVGGLLGFVFLWLQWVLWIRMGFDQGPMMALHFATSGPVGWIKFLGMLAERLREIEPGRFMVGWLPLWWALEAALLIWLPASIAGMGGDEPYSEAAGAWASKELEGELWWDEGSSAELPSRLAAEGVDFLLAMPRAIDMLASVATQWWTVTVAGWEVEADPTARWLDIGIAIQTRDDNGKVKVERRSVTSRWPVSTEDYERLSEHLRRRRVAATDQAGSDDQARPTPPELEAAVEALQADDFSSALALAEAQRQHPDPLVKADAHRLCALCEARLERWSAAFDDYLALFELEPGATNALQLASTSVMSGELARAQAWFKKAEALNAEAHSMPWPQMHTNFLSALSQKGEYAAGLPHLEWLRGMFLSMSSTDDHFVFTHDMPFISVFFEKSLPFLRASMPEADVLAWYRDMRAELDELGQTKLDAWLSELAKSERQAVLLAEGETVLQK